MNFLEFPLGYLNIRNLLLQLIQENPTEAAQLSKRLIQIEILIRELEIFYFTHNLGMFTILYFIIISIIQIFFLCLMVYPILRKSLKIFKTIS